MTAPHTVVVGAGPVGLATAILLAQQGHVVTVHETGDSLTFDDDNSYPIGVNPRGQETLRRIDPALVDALHERGELVEGFRIRAGRRVVASLESGTLIGTTRARLTNILAERAAAEPAITVEFGHKLECVDVDARALHFRTASGPLVVDASESLVVGCDGVWSRVRRSLEAQREDFRPRVDDWGVQFRVLFSRPGATAPGLDPAWHHIFTSKGIYTATLPDGVWCVAVTAIAGDEAEDLLLSTDPSDTHVSALRDHLARHAPLTVPLLTRDDLRAFFSRAPFGGAVVRCPRVHEGEWLALLGDAAHSVIPPTGEGVNAGLEDARVLADVLASGSANPLSDYDARRVPDLAALGVYAMQLRDDVAERDAVRSATNVGLRIVSALLARFGRDEGEVERRLFGPDAGTAPYREVIGPWIGFRDRWRPPIRRLVRPARRALPARGGREDRPGRAHVARAEGSGRRVVIVGASSGTGEELACRAVALGHDVTCVSRRGSAPEGATVVRGDASDLEVARRAVRGADAVIVTVGGARSSRTARTTVTLQVIEAMRAEGVRRLVVQTSLGTGDSARRLPPPLRPVVGVLLRDPLADHEQQEAAVRASGLDWTIVRPAGLTNAAWTGEVTALAEAESGRVGPRVGPRVGRADVAAFLLQCLDDESANHRTVDLGGA